MAIKKRIKVCILFCVLIIGIVVNIVNVYGAYWTNSVLIDNIPGGGSSKTNYNIPNTKESSSNHSSFYTQSMTASLGNTALIVDSNGVARSYNADLYRESLTRSENKGAYKGQKYYCRVHSHFIEWGKSNLVVLDFSSDYNTK